MDWRPNRLCYRTIGLSKFIWAILAFEQMLLFSSNICFFRAIFACFEQIGLSGNCRICLKQANIARKKQYLLKSKYWSNKLEKAHFFSLTPTSTSDCRPISGFGHWGVGVFWDRSRRLRWLTIMTVFQNWTLCFFAYQLIVTGFTQVWRSNVA